METGARLAILLFLSASCGGARDKASVFVGDVSEGDTFRKSIGNNLDFVLQPSTMQPGVITGWTIAISPHQPAGEPDCVDFAWVATPPYHFQNVLYLDTSYATTAQEVVRASPREFKFVLNWQDLERESERVRRLLQAGDYSREEIAEARAKLLSSALGVGQLWILDYGMKPGKRALEGVDLGRIDWIKFKLEIQIPDLARPQTN